MKKPDKGLAHRELAWPLSEKHCIRARRSSHDYFCPISHAGQHGLGGAAWPARPSSVQWNMGADLPASSLGLLREAQTVKNLPALRAIQVWTLDWEDLLEKGLASHSRIPAWRISWTEEPGGLQSVGSQRVRHDWATNTHMRRSEDDHRGTVISQRRTWVGIQAKGWGGGWTRNTCQLKPSWSERPSNYCWSPERWLWVKLTAYPFSSGSKEWDNQRRRRFIILQIQGLAWSHG